MEDMGDYFLVVAAFSKTYPEDILLCNSKTFKIIYTDPQREGRVSTPQLRPAGGSCNAKLPKSRQDNTATHHQPVERPQVNPSNWLSLENEDGRQTPIHCHPRAYLIHTLHPRRVWLLSPAPSKGRHSMLSHVYSGFSGASIQHNQVLCCSENRVTKRNEEES